MIKPNLNEKSYVARISALLICLVLLALMPGCSSEKNAALKAVEQTLKPLGVRDVKVDSFLVSKTSPDVAFIAVTATWNFADASGKPQKEMLGYLLKKNGQEWKIEKSVPYDPKSPKSRDAMKDF
jgi:hypothetical protein